MLNEWDSPTNEEEEESIGPKRYWLGPYSSTKISGYGESSDEDSDTDEADDGVDLICYGLVKFSSSKTALYQLGFLLLLKKMLHSEDVYIYDPSFTKREVQFLKEIGLNVLERNEKAKREVKRKTVAFMPNCHPSLYDNLLWANWKKKNF